MFEVYFKQTIGARYVCFVSYLWGIVAGAAGGGKCLNHTRKTKRCLLENFQTKLLTNTFVCANMEPSKEETKMANNISFGYIRVSSKDQNESRQIEKMRELGIDERHIFIDKESGKDFDREQYKALVTMLRDGDVLYVPSIDRLGRNYNEILTQWSVITKEKGADIVVLDMPLLDTRNDRDLTGTLISDIVLQLLSYVAQKERENIRTRQAEGIAIAKAKGVYKGRKPIEVDRDKFELVYGEVSRGERTNKYAMQKLGLKPNTYYRFVREFKTKTGLWGE